MKRLCDIVLALILLVPVAIFVYVLAALIVAIDDYHPFYRQRRIGRNGKMFWCLKLQTMKPASDPSVIGVREKDAERKTWFGDIIRDHGWDELPQIWNVLIGQMSFVGPRPLLEKTYERIEDANRDRVDYMRAWAATRKTVRAGVTGWHQVHIDEPCSMVKRDMEYLLDSPKYDVRKVMWVTIGVFLLGKRRLKELRG